jgi:hypothetical protein
MKSKGEKTEGRRVGKPAIGLRCGDLYTWVHVHRHNSANTERREQFLCDRHTVGHVMRIRSGVYGLATMF